MPGRRTVRQIFNSALLLAPDGRILGRYHKQQLLAFGEYIPLQRYLPFLRHISPTIGESDTRPWGHCDFTERCRPWTAHLLRRYRARPGAAGGASGRPDLGQSHQRHVVRPDACTVSAPSLAAFRAVENRVYLVRVTNTGLTSIIDALGREQVALPLFQADTLVHTIQPLRLASLYTRFGDWFAQLCSAAALLLPLWCWYRQR